MKRPTEDEVMMALAFYESESVLAGHGGVQLRSSTVHRISLPPFTQYEVTTRGEVVGRSRDLAEAIKLYCEALS